ncbi:MAG TPA: carbon-nitrogen hydrolase family protein [Candidatus Blautia avistercoris]|nr:carbon-nitrogen hydrolase family protein [Candidatus Blautia avistercoris]
MHLNVAQLQTRVCDSKKENLQKLEVLLEKACKEKADLITLPEMFCCPYETERFPVYAEETGGEAYSFCARLAEKYQIYLSAGSIPERDEAGRIYNTAYVFDREGKQIAKHRKMHLFDIQIEGGQHFKESDTLSPGDQVTVFPTEFGTMGLCICYDFRFPELARLMALEGAQILLVPAAFNLSTGPAHWELMFRSQSVNNQVFSIGTAPARDLSASYHSWGHSIITDPWGSVLSQMDEQEGMTVSVLDLDLIDRIRSQLPLLCHRRTDLYRLAPVVHEEDSAAD